MIEHLRKLDFKIMAAMIAVRDLYRPRSRILEEVGLEEGFHIMDFGCGPGSYAVLAAEMVGEAGRVYALDANPLAVRKVEDKAARNGFGNVRTILSDCATRLADGSVDLVLLYDVFHELNNRADVLRELRRVLKPGGALSFSDHHMKEEEILKGMTGGGLFAAAGKGRFTYSFTAAG